MQQMGMDQDQIDGFEGKRTGVNQGGCPGKLSQRREKPQQERTSQEPGLVQFMAQTKQVKYQEPKLRKLLETETGQGGDAPRWDV